MHRRLDIDVVVTLTLTLVTADFLVLTLSLLHEGLELGIITLGDGLGLHLDCQVAVGGLDGCADVDNGLLEAGDTLSLVQAGAGQDVQRRRHQLDLDLGVLCVLGLGGAQGSLDGVDALVAEAGDLNIGTDLGGLGSKTLANVRLELLGNRLAREGDVVPDLGLAAIELDKRRRLAR